MNERERFRETLLFGSPDRIPLEPGHPRESTLEAWHQQGLPEDIDWHDHLMIEEGGFIPGCDHGVPPDFSWPNYVAYTRILAQLTGWL